MTSIDLNADLGEGTSEADFVRDRAILAHVTSCSIACGGHAGDEQSMRRTLRAAREAGVTVGAHPSYPDKEGFGRRSLDIDEDALTESLEAQVAALRAIAREEDVRLSHIKPHGALYNDAARDEARGDTIARFCERQGLPMIALAGSPLATQAVRRVCVLAEGFADRRYRGDGSLTPRSEPDALITDQALQADQALRLARGEPIETADGPLSLRVQTICLHADTDGATEGAAALRSALAAAGLRVEAVNG